MEKVMLLLFKLNDKLYNLKIHTIICILWVWSIINFHNFFTLWFKLGLFSWAFLIFWDWKLSGFSKGHWKKVLSRVATKEKGILPFLVGLNISVVFGPLSILLSLMISKTMKKDK